jgi:hypothetical protein
VPCHSERADNEVLNFARVQALDKLAQVPVQRHLD